MQPFCSELDAGLVVSILELEVAAKLSVCKTRLLAQGFGA